MDEEKYSKIGVMEHCQYTNVIKTREYNILHVCLVV